MNIEDMLTALERWAKINKADKQLMGKYDDADFFDLVEQTTALVLTQRTLIAQLEEWNRHLESEIARLSQLAIK